MPAESENPWFEMVRSKSVIIIKYVYIGIEDFGMIINEILKRRRIRYYFFCTTYFLYVMKV